MNERIRALADQAGLQPFEDCGPGYVYKMEKFAELIVQDCAKVCADSGMRSGGGCTTTGEVYLRASKAIRAQFGMETFGLY